MEDRSIRQAQDKSYWLGWSQVPKVGPTRFAQLLSYFGSAEAAWHASEKELVDVLKPALTEHFLDVREKFSLAEYEEKMQKAKVLYVTLIDPNYPQLLKVIKNPPFVLFMKGKLEILNQTNVIPDSSALSSLPKGLIGDPENRELDSRLRGNDTGYIGVVGTRKITDYGRQVTESITQELVDAGCIIVSGLAMGVDAVAHQTTIDNGGKTIAVLGCGVDCCYPRENQRLYENILDSGGLIVSEFGLGKTPTIGSFPSRNRIIAGLSQGVVVTEGAVDSGALITAKDAFENNRKVFAVPGPVTSSLSKGPYDLIKKGAVVVSSGKEILEELEIMNPFGKLRTGHESRIKNKKIKGDTKEEQKILELLSEQELHFDELVRKTNIDSKQLGTILSMMEMKGMIKTMSAGYFGLLT